MGDDILNIEKLKVSFDVYGGSVQAVRDVSLRVKQGEILALVGESGCGKSVMAQSILRLNPSPPSHMAAESLILDGEDIVKATEREMEKLRGRAAGMIFQDPLTCLNPTMRIGRQITEMPKERGGLSAPACEAEAVRLLEKVQIKNAGECAKQYPHQLSGGMRQRVMIAMALAGNPKLLIADEPTTALDVTIQLEILRLLLKLRNETGMSILLITHDFTVVANMADKVAVMYAGKIVEESGRKELFANPSHPYTQGLLKSLPGPEETGELMSIPGSPPDLFAPPKGCSFADRCEYCMRLCEEEEPPLFTVEENHTAACWRLHANFPKGEQV